VIRVRVRAHDEVDLFGRDAGQRQPFEPVVVALVEARKVRPILVITAAAIDQHVVAAGLDEKASHRRSEFPFGDIEMQRRHPVHVFGQRLGIGIREEQFRHETRLRAFLDLTHQRTTNSQHSDEPLFNR